MSDTLRGIESVPFQTPIIFVIIHKDFQGQNLKRWFGVLYFLQADEVKGKKCVVICCGGNIDPAVHRQVIESQRKKTNKKKWKDRKHRRKNLKIMLLKGCVANFFCGLVLGPKRDPKKAFDNQLFIKYYIIS